jgi:hypothetical protein
MNVNTAHFGERGSYARNSPLIQINVRTIETSGIQGVLLIEPSQASSAFDTLRIIQVAEVASPHLVSNRSVK